MIPFREDRAHLGETNKMYAMKQYFQVVLFLMLYKVLLLKLSMKS